MRPFSYSASIVPVLVGSAVALHDGYGNWILFLFALFGSISIHAGTNLANEYFDYTQGVDKPDSLGPAGVIIEGKISPKHVLWAAVVAFGFGTILGLYIAYRVGWVILAIGFASVLAAWFYTAKPFSLGYRGLGEAEVFVFMGPVMVVASYYVQTETFAWTPLLISLPVGFLVTAILHVNNLRDIVQDNERERLTWTVLACRLLGFERGKDFSRWIFHAMVAAAYVTVTVLITTDVAPLAAFLTLLTVPQAYHLIRFVASGVEGKALSRAVRETAFLHLSFGVTLTLGYILNGLMH